MHNREDLFENNDIHNDGKGEIQAVIFGERIRVLQFQCVKHCKFGSTRVVNVY